MGLSRAKRRGEEIYAVMVAKARVEAKDTV